MMRVLRGVHYVGGDPPTPTNSPYSFFKKKQFKTKKIYFENVQTNNTFA